MRLSELVGATGLHRNTVREHLDALLDDGLVERRRAPADGRGRPAWLYRATDGSGTAGHEYAGLATALASLVARTSSSPAEDAAIAGAEWGRRAGRQRSAPRGPPPLPAPVGG